MNFLADLSRKMLYVAVPALFVSAGAAVYIARAESPQAKTQPTVQKVLSNRSGRMPIIKDTTNFPVLTAQGVYAFDLDSGVVLYEKNSSENLYPASTTKMVTALVALDDYGLNKVLTVGPINVEGSKMGLLWGEKMTVENLLYGLLVHSANDAAEVLASDYPGGRAAFVEKMNEKAQELHAQNTHFVNPSGLDQDGQTTTAKDLARIANYAMGVKEFAKIVGTESYVSTDVTGKFKHSFTNRNELLGNVDGVLGVKTGWTDEARENLVTYVNREGKRVVIVTLGSQDRFGETKELIDWIYSNYEWKDVNYLPEYQLHNTLQ